MLPHRLLPPLICSFFSIYQWLLIQWTTRSLSLSQQYIADCTFPVCILMGQSLLLCGDDSTLATGVPQVPVLGPFVVSVPLPMTMHQLTISFQLSTTDYHRYADFIAYLITGKCTLSFLQNYKAQHWGSCQIFPARSDRLQTLWRCTAWGALPGVMEAERQGKFVCVTCAWQCVILQNPVCDSW